jgi:hypothetical protein
MIGLFSSLLTVMGSAGLGSILKIVAVVVGKIGEAKKWKAKQELVRELQHNKANIRYERLLYGDTKVGMANTLTRRVIGFVAVTGVVCVTLLSTIWPDVPLVTLTDGEGTAKFLFGLVEFPVNKERPVVLSSGHLAVIGLSLLSACLGFIGTDPASSGDR